MDNERRKNTRRLERVELPDASPGTSRRLDFIHYGKPGQGPKAYLQAALHADEIPGLLVIHKLMGLLNQADAEGRIVGYIVLAPVANPVGNGQHFLGELSGRYDHANGINFNRNYPDLLDEIALRVEDDLTDDERVNTRLIRKAALDILAENAPQDQSDVLKNTLAKYAIDADIVLDLHCDWQSVMHIYTGTRIWPQVRDLAAYLGAEVSLLAETSGGNPFDEALSGLWWGLMNRFPDKPIANGCVAATVELRGKADVEEHQAGRDAQALFNYLQSCRIIEGSPPEAPALLHPATPLDGVEKIVSPIAGVVSYSRQPGDVIAAGELVCTVFDIREYDVDKARIELKASAAGVLYSRRLDRLARPGQTLCRIAGEHSLPGASRHLLTD